MLLNVKYLYKINIYFNSNKLKLKLIMSSSEQLSRKQMIYMTKIYNKTKQLEEAIYFSSKFIEKNPKLTKDERKIFVSSFKNIITKKRTAWRILNKKESEETNENNLQYLLEIKYEVEKEIKEIISFIINIIDECLLEVVEEVEEAVFYSKLKADYLRYLTEIIVLNNNTNNNLSEEEEKDKLIYLNETENTYHTAYMLAIQKLPELDITRIGLILNYSIFLWEIKKNKQEAAYIAQSCYNEVFEKYNELESSENKECILLFQLIRENLMMWNKDEELINLMNNDNIEEVNNNNNSENKENSLSNNNKNNSNYDEVENNNVDDEKYINNNDEEIQNNYLRN